jgi:hypothetical protein
MMHSWRVPSEEVGSGFGEVRGGATSEGVFSVFHLVFNFVVASTCFRIPVSGSYQF